MEKTTKYCIACKKVLKQTICFVDECGIALVNFPMVSRHYGKTMHIYICDDCIDKAEADGSVEKV